MQTQRRQRFLNQGSEAVWHRRPQPGGFEPGPSRYRDSETTLVGLGIQLEAQRRAALFYPEVAGGAVFDGETTVSDNRNHVSTARGTIRTRNDGGRGSRRFLRDSLRAKAEG
jgi:hypothetical protein